MGIDGFYPNHTKELRKMGNVSPTNFFFDHTWDQNAPFFGDKLHLNWQMFYSALFIHIIYLFPLSC